ncbi:TonB-dependent receptor [Planctobacterium marinum]|uniref:Outer membrane protein n=1 Tax=Planctobacterium marinum TaxID=1631968 RepID=A0AA48I1N1_9ALTE|nr:outer membrane protein [Planctobacterium marinum]
MKTGLRTTLSLVAMACSLPSIAATVSGTVTDINGKPVVGATVLVEGSSVRATTDADGRYTLNNVSDDRAHVHVYSAKHVHGDKEILNPDANHTADFVLRPAIIENVTVTANALERSVLESTMPVSVLGGEELKRNQAATLGDTLKNLPGVHSTYFGPVSSSPVIRGADGPRVKIVQNGLDSSDASRVGPDHNVAADGTSATQIEVLRGPATLQYGNGAIGGVVNVVDNRIPRYVPDSVEGEAELRYDSVSDEEFARIDLNAGTGNVAFHFDAFDRQTDNYDIPGYAESEPHEGEEPGTLSNSAIDTTSYTAGLSWVNDKGYVGFSVQQLDNLYGVPGHAHGHEDEHGHEEEHEEDHAEEHGEEEIVNLNVDMRRYQIAGEFLSPFTGVSKIKFASGFTDYEHVEIEAGEIGTTFINETDEHRISLEHEGLAGWHGVLGLHYSNTDYAAIGAEAFTPPSETDSFAMFLIEEKQFGDVTVQLGIRYDATDIDPIDSITLENLHIEEEHHDEEHEEDEHEGDEHDEHEEHEETVTLNLFEQSFESLSLSAGANWQYQEGRSVALSLSHSERAPSHQELFSAGNHIATRTFDVGTLYSINEHGEFGPALQQTEEEISTNLDLTFRKFDGDWGYTVSLFYNQVDDYLYQADTGLFAEDSHAHEEDEHHEEEEHDEHEEHEGDEHGDEHGEEEGTPVFVFQQQDATFYGIEAELYNKLSDNLTLKVYGDYIRGSLDHAVNGSRNLPRIPPMRIGAELDFDWNNWYGDVGVTWYDDQTRVSNFETATDGYTLVNFSVNYRQAWQGADWVFYLRGKNLTDEEARVHTSFLKDLAPLPGRSFAVGVRAEF